MLLFVGLDFAIALTAHDGFECHALLVANRRRHSAVAGIGDPTSSLPYP
ncbi:MAG: hypothetical protein ABI728_10425 [Betaproteobacteria bacterium]